MGLSIRHDANDNSPYIVRRAPNRSYNQRTCTTITMRYTLGRSWEWEYDFQDPFDITVRSWWIRRMAGASSLNKWRWSQVAVWNLCPWNIGSAQNAASFYPVHVIGRMTSTAWIPGRISSTITHEQTRVIRSKTRFKESCGKEWRWPYQKVTDAAGIWSSIFMKTARQ